MWGCIQRVRIQQGEQRPACARVGSIGPARWCPSARVQSAGMHSRGSSAQDRLWSANDMPAATRTHTKSQAHGNKQARMHRRAPAKRARARIGLAAGEEGPTLALGPAAASHPGKQHSWASQRRAPSTRLLVPGAQRASRSGQQVAAPRKSRLGKAASPGPHTASGLTVLRGNGGEPLAWRAPRLQGCLRSRCRSRSRSSRSRATLPPSPAAPLASGLDKLAAYPQVLAERTSSTPPMRGRLFAGGGRNLRVGPPPPPPPPRPPGLPGGGPRPSSRRLKTSPTPRMLDVRFPGCGCGMCTGNSSGGMRRLSIRHPASATARELGHCALVQ